VQDSNALCMHNLVSGKVQQQGGQCSWHGLGPPAANSTHGLINRRSSCPPSNPLVFTHALHPV
jgi:hypothetical protein